MFVPTRSSKLKQEKGDSFTKVVFHSRKSENASRESAKEEERNTERRESKDKNMDIKKLRYEVIRFGSSGFEGSRKEESELALAVSLGAKPPKRKCKNYKEILMERKTNKDARGKLIQNVIQSKKKGLKRRKNKNESRGLLNEYGNVRVNK